MNRSVDTYRTGIGSWRIGSSIQGFIADLESDLADLIVETINELTNSTTDLFITVRGIFK